MSDASRMVRIAKVGLWIVLLLGAIGGAVLWKVNVKVSGSFEREVVDDVSHAFAVYLCDQEIVDGVIEKTVRDVFRHDTTLGPEPKVGDRVPGRFPDRVIEDVHYSDQVIVLIMQPSGSDQLSVRRTRVEYSVYSGVLVADTLDVTDIRELARRKREQ